MTLLERLGVTIPIVQAPMAGVSTPALAAAVSNAGGLGSLGVGASDAADARSMIEATRALTDRAFNVNLFVHATPRIDKAREQGWLDALRPLFESYGAEPPSTLRPIYKSFADDDEMLAMLIEAAPPIVSFHFGVPSADRVAALKQAGCLLLASATSPPRPGRSSARASTWSWRRAGKLAGTGVCSIRRRPTTGLARWP
jgi:nitronate monooxygenase